MPSQPKGNSAKKKAAPMRTSAKKKGASAKKKAAPKRRQSNAEQAVESLVPTSPGFDEALRWMRSEGAAAELQALHENLQASSGRFEISSRILLAILSGDDVGAQCYVLRALASDHPGSDGIDVLGVVYRDEPTRIAFASNPWNIKPESTLDEALAQVWKGRTAAIKQAAPTLARQLTGLVLLGDSHGKYQLGYIFIKPRDRYELTKKLVRLSTPGYERATAARWSGRADLCMFIGDAPATSRRSTPTLPQGLLELSRIHAGLREFWSLDTRELIPLEQLWGSPPVSQPSAALTYFRKRNRQSPSELLLFFNYGDERNDVIDLSELDYRKEPMVRALPVGGDAGRLGKAIPFDDWFSEFLRDNALGLDDEDDDQWWPVEPSLEEAFGSKLPPHKKLTPAWIEKRLPYTDDIFRALAYKEQRGHIAHASCIKALGLIGNDEALEILSTYWPPEDDDAFRNLVGFYNTKYFRVGQSVLNVFPIPPDRLVEQWERFNSRKFAEQFFANSENLAIHHPINNTQLNELSSCIPDIQNLRLHLLPDASLSSLTALTQLARLQLDLKKWKTNTKPLGRLSSLKQLVLFNSHSLEKDALSSLSHIAQLRHLAIDVGPKLNLDFLLEMKSLKRLALRLSPRKDYSNLEELLPPLTAQGTVVLLLGGVWLAQFSRRQKNLYKTTYIKAQRGEKYHHLVLSKRAHASCVKALNEGDSIRYLETDKLQ